MSKLDTFVPDNQSNPDAGVYGIPCTEEEAKAIIIPIPWEATTSYGNGAGEGPAAIYDASMQQDLYQLDLKDVWRQGIYMREADPVIETENTKYKAIAQSIIKGECGDRESSVASVNAASERINKLVEEQVTDVYNKGKLPVVLGGDHSVPYGAFVATGKHHGDFGILHFDAHADLRKAYMGFKYSHASIMNNALEIPQLLKLVQVGIRDFGYGEMEIIDNDDRLYTYFDKELKSWLNDGVTWNKIAQSIVEALPSKVWISFDIDGLDPALCPNTGTPVVGGLSFDQADTLIKLLAKSGKTIVGCDLNEVAPDPEGRNDWDANVGMRLLYRMIGWTLHSNGLVQEQ
jgi:agmatinase